MKIQFFPNTGDGTHCFQAALMMVLGVVMPHRKFTYMELDKISDKLKGKWTWPTSAMLWMLQEGLKIDLIEEFDYQSFIDSGEKYLEERYGKEIAKAQSLNSNIDRERETARNFIALSPLEYRVPTIADIKNKIKANAVVIVNLNAALLHEQDGYSGHFVVVCDVMGETVNLHDPGLPPFPNLIVPLERFERAWGYPSKRDKNLLAVSRAQGKQ